MVRAAPDVLERARPAAAIVADAAVLEAPGRHSRSRERRTDGPDVPLAIFRGPAAAVDHDRDGMGPRSTRNPQLAELLRPRPVRDARIGGRGLEGEHLLERHALAIPGPHSSRGAGGQDAD